MVVQLPFIQTHPRNLLWLKQSTASVSPWCSTNQRVDLTVPILGAELIYCSPSSLWRALRECMDVWHSWIPKKISNSGCWIQAQIADCNSPAILQWWGKKEDWTNNSLWTPFTLTFLFLLSLHCCFVGGGFGCGFVCFFVCLFVILFFPPPGEEGRREAHVLWKFTENMTKKKARTTAKQKYWNAVRLQNI